MRNNTVMPIYTILYKASLYPQSYSILKLGFAKLLFSVSHCSVVDDRTVHSVAVEVVSPTMSLSSVQCIQCK